MRLGFSAIALATIATTSCGYTPGFADCLVQCTPAGDCPDGLACIDGRCRTGESQLACSPIATDGGDLDAEDHGLDGEGSDDGGPEDAQLPSDATSMVTLSQSISLTSNTSISCGIQPGETKTNQWWRVFRLSDANYGITAPTIHITSVVFPSQAAVDATVDVDLWTYTGTYDASPLDTTMLVHLARVELTNVNGAQEWVVPFSQDVATTAMLAVEVSSNDRASASGGVVTQFHLGANDAGQTGKSYLGGSCFNAPTSIANKHFILRAQGTY